MITFDFVYDNFEIAIALFLNLVNANLEKILILLYQPN